MFVCWLSDNENDNLGLSGAAYFSDNYNGQRYSSSKLEDKCSIAVKSFATVSFNIGESLTRGKRFFALHREYQEKLRRL